MESERGPGTPRPRKDDRRVPSERGEEGDAAPASLSSEALWAAFDDAVTDAQAELADAARQAELDGFPAALRNAVRLPFIAGPGQVDASRAVSIGPLLDSVRRKFIERVGALGAPGGPEMQAVLQALTRLERAIPGVESPVDVRQGRGVDPLALSIAIAHDMRSPLTAILFLLDILRSGRTGPVTAAQGRQLGIAYGAAFGLSQMASDLIDHARGNVRMIDTSPVPFSVTELLHAVRDILAPLLEERTLEMRIVPLTNDARIGLPTVLQRVLLNLATNAVKFTRTGAVTVSASDHGDWVRFGVEDTGPGIAPAVQAQLFQPFRSTADGKPAFSSSGLGLSICKQLVTALGSELRVRSGEGEGTTFFFDVDLPIARAN